MGVDVYVFEICSRFSKKKLFHEITENRLLRTKFKKRVKKRKETERDVKIGLRDSGLNSRRWNYNYTNDEGYDSFIHMTEDKRIFIQKSKFPIIKIKRPFLRVKEIGYWRVSGKLYSSWYSIADFLTDNNLFLAYELFLTILSYNDAKNFRDIFVKERFKPLFDKIILNKITKNNQFIMISW